MRIMHYPIFILIILSTLTIPSIISSASAELVPEWIRNTAKWYGDGSISETEFINAIKYLIENNIIKLAVASDMTPHKATTAYVFIPNGNSKMGNAGFFTPLHLEIQKGTTVVWINDDTVGHTVQSQDGQGNVISRFNSDVLKTGDRFAYKFDEDGIYYYFCTIHPWRVGVITVK